MCQSKDETVTHLVCECSTIAQSEYKGSNDSVGTAVHWSLAKKYALQNAYKWYDYRADAASENNEVKLLWDLNMMTIQARRRGIVLVKKVDKECIIIDVAIPADSTSWNKEEEKRTSTES